MPSLFRLGSDITLLLSLRLALCVLPWQLWPKLCQLLVVLAIVIHVVVQVHVVVVVGDVVVVQA